MLFFRNPHIKWVLIQKIKILNLKGQNVKSCMWIDLIIPALFWKKRKYARSRKWWNVEKKENDL